MTVNKKRNIHDLIKEHSGDKVLDTETIYEINLEDIKANPEQPRKHFNEKSLNELASSIKEHGVFQPIIIKNTNDGYIIVSGERRHRASKIAGLKKIPAVIRNYSTSKVAEISLVENLQREDLSPIEEAIAYNILIEELELTQKELADKIGKSRSYVTNMLGLLNLPEEIKELILDKKITAGHARVLSKMDNKEEMVKLAKQIIKDGLNVRDVERISKEGNLIEVTKKKNFNKIYKVERNMIAKYYDSKVSIRNNQVVLKVKDEEEIKELIEKLMKNAL